MRIAAVLGVKDDVELIASSIAHLRTIGVDQIAVYDVGSTDGTLDVLSDESRAGDVSVSHMPEGELDYAEWSAFELDLARQTRADWVIFLDADEYPIPAGGSLRASLQLRDADILVLDRFNVVLTPAQLMMPAALSPAGYSDLLLLTRQVAHFRTFLLERPEVPFVTVRPGPKVMARPGLVAAVAPGGHDVVARVPSARRAVAQDFIVAHVPFSSMRRFARKVANIRDEIVRRPALFVGDYAWHWRRWAEMDDAALHEEFARQVADDVTLRRWRNEGVLHSAADLLRARHAAAVAAVGR